MKFLLLALMSIITSIGIAQNIQTQALIGVDIYNGTSDDLKRMTILIEGGKIKDIFKTDSKTLPDSIFKIELSGFYVIPGLIDTHVHLGQRELSQSHNDSRKEFKKWLYSGVTSVRDMGGDARALEYENQLIKKNKQPGPDIYFSATVGSSDMIAKDMRLKMATSGLGANKAGYVIEATEDMDIKQSVSLAVNSQVSGIKFYAGIKSDLIKAITTEAHSQGLKSWAHFTVFPDRPIEVIKAGVDAVSHIWGAFWQDEDVDPSEKIPFTHTDFNNARSAIFPKDLSLLNTDSPELLLLFNEMKNRDVIWDLTYSVPNPVTREIYKKYALAASLAGVEFSTGTDHFNDINESYPSLFAEIENLVKDGILDPRKALFSATFNGARVIGIDKTHGTIEKGKVANLVVLQKNPTEDISNIRQIEFTMKNGIIYNRIDYK
jgi:imidazolonepropionase-like amidohydrolase